MKRPREGGELDAAATVGSCFLAGLRGLPAGARPSPEQGIVAAAVVATWPGGSACLSIGCGTRCVGWAKVTPTLAAVGISDCHAEVLARRAFVRGMLDAVASSTATTSIPDPWGSVLSVDPSGSAALRPGVELHLAVSAVPCGDACISAEAVAVSGGIPGGHRIQPSTPEGPQPHHDEVHGFYVSRHANGVDDQDVGATRVKPGRGPPSLCMSCSDKIAAWAVLGLQGGVPGLVLAAAPLASVVIAARFDPTAARRALCRGGAVAVSGVPDEMAAAVAEATGAGRPMMGAAVAWWAGKAGAELINPKSGLRLGVTEKAVAKADTADHRRRIELRIGRASIARCVVDHLGLVPDGAVAGAMSYSALKARRAEYRAAKAAFREKLSTHGAWAVKPRPDFAV